MGDGGAATHVGYMQIIATAAELPGRTIEVGGVSVWDPSRFILLGLILLVAVVGALVVRYMERRDDEYQADQAREAVFYRDGC